MLFLLSQYCLKLLIRNRTLNCFMFVLIYMSRHGSLVKGDVGFVPALKSELISQQRDQISNNVGNFGGRRNKWFDWLYRSLIINKKHDRWPLIHNPVSLTKIRMSLPNFLKMINWLCHSFTDSLPVFEYSFVSKYDRFNPGWGWGHVRDWIWFWLCNSPTDFLSFK